MTDKPKHFSLGHARQSAITALVVIIALKVVLWALLPLLPYLIAFVVLFTVCGIAIYRHNHF